MDETQKLKEQISSLEKQVRDLEGDLIHDHLTNLKTRAFFEEETAIYLHSIVKFSDGKRKNWFGFKNLSILFIDVDHFKKINDTYGHDVGDIVLKKVSQTINHCVRQGDTVARWGGEEIIVSLLGANEIDAKNKAEEIRVNIQDLFFDEHPDLKVTASIGISSYYNDVTLKDLISGADKALYDAKNGGRNKVVIHTKNIG